MKLSSIGGDLEIINDSTYSFGSVDNARNYLHEWDLAGDYVPNCIYGLLLAGKPLVVLGASGGATGVNAHSAVIIGARLYLAICDTVACIQLNPVDLLWSKQIDSATCFGIYYRPDQRALYSHGELEIVRFNEDGQVPRTMGLWRNAAKGTGLTPVPSPPKNPPAIPDRHRHGFPDAVLKTDRFRRLAAVSCQTSYSAAYNPHNHRW